MKATFHADGSVLIEWTEQINNPLKRDTVKIMRNAVVDPEWITDFCYTEKELRKLKLQEIMSKEM